MRDILDHLRYCQEQVAMADEPGVRFLADSMKRDIDEFRRLCDGLLNVSHFERRPAAAAA
jgi:hypothetical protein